MGWYPKCSPGWRPGGTLWECYPDQEPGKTGCNSMGMAHVAGFSASCYRQQRCEDWQELDAGLCYEKCRDGEKGVGPVCWTQPPTGWKHCGMGAVPEAACCGCKIWKQTEAV